MGKFIIKLERGDDAWYMEWSTTSDAPSCYGMSLAELRDRCLKKSGTDGVRDWDERVARIDATGTSLLGHPGETAETAIDCNRCGPDEAELSYDQIIDKYCVGRPAPKTKPVDHTRAITQLRLLINSVFVVRHEEMQSPGWQSPMGGLVVPPKVSHHWWDHPSRRLDIARLRSYIGAVRVLERRA